MQSKRLAKSVGGQLVGQRNPRPTHDQSILAQVTCTSCPFTVDGTTLTIEGSGVVLFLATNLTALRSISVIPPPPPKVPPPKPSKAWFLPAYPPMLDTQYQCNQTIGNVRFCIWVVVVVDVVVTSSSSSMTTHPIPQPTKPFKMALEATNPDARNTSFLVQCPGASTLRIRNFRGGCVQALFPVADRGMPGVRNMLVIMCSACPWANYK